MSITPTAPRLAPSVSTVSGEPALPTVHSDGPTVQTAASAPTLAPTRPSAAALAVRTVRPAPRVNDYARRMAFLTELDSQTWVSRYSAAERLGDPGAVTSVADYTAWLRRTAAAWAALPMPTADQGAAVWPFGSASASILDCLGSLEADLAELASATGGPRSAGTSTGATALVRRQRSSHAADEDCDSAFVAGAAYVAISAAQEVAVLAADVEHLAATAGRPPLPQHHLHHAVSVNARRTSLRRELAEWVDQAGPDAAERVILTARMLLDRLADGLVNGTQHHP